jgi:hypothetical protein
MTDALDEPTARDELPETLVQAAKSGEVCCRKRFVEKRPIRAISGCEPA